MQGMHQYPRYSPISTPRPTAPKAPESSAKPFKSILPPLPQLPRMPEKIDDDKDIPKIFDSTKGITALKDKYKFFEDARIYGEGRKIDTEINKFYDKFNDKFNDKFKI